MKWFAIILFILLFLNGVSQNSSDLFIELGKTQLETPKKIYSKFEVLKISKSKNNNAYVIDLTTNTYIDNSQNETIFIINSHGYTDAYKQEQYFTVISLISNKTFKKNNFKKIKKGDVVILTVIPFYNYYVPPIHTWKTYIVSGELVKLKHIPYGMVATTPDLKGLYLDNAKFVSK
jgi:hypothetical protein